MTILVVKDLDGVSYDFVTRLGDHAAEVTGRPRAEFVPAQTWNFAMEQWGLDLDDFLGLMQSGYDAKQVFWTGDPLPGAIEGWTRIAALDGIHIQVVTDRPVDVGAVATTGWLAEHGLSYHSLAVTADKVAAVNELADEIGATRILTIEDRDKNHIAYRDAGFDAYLLTRPWNAHVDEDRRCRDLNEFADVVETTHQLLAITA